MKLKPMSRRLLATVLAAAFAGAVSSVPAQAQTASRKPFRVVTTFTIIQDIAQNVAGDKAIVESITKPGAEIHDYQPTPLDIVRAQAADLVLWNGFNLERWFEKFFENVKQVPSVVVTPARLVRRLITERGLVAADESALRRLMEAQP